VINSHSRAEESIPLWMKLLEVPETTKTGNSSQISDIEVLHSFKTTESSEFYIIVQPHSHAQ